MRPLTYVDIGVVSVGSGAESGSGDPRIAGIVFGALHRCFRNAPGRFAVAFPDGKGFMAVIRVFASTHDELEELGNSLASSRVVRDYALPGRPKAVPEDYSGPWVQFRRFRIPSRKSDRKPGAPLRARRLLEADERRLPYLLVHSGSTGQSFGLRFECLPGEPNEGACHPDGYGLARASAPFSLPDLAA